MITVEVPGVDTSGAGVAIDGTTVFSAVLAEVVLLPIFAITAEVCGVKASGTGMVAGAAIDGAAVFPTGLAEGGCDELPSMPSFNTAAETVVVSDVTPVLEASKPRVPFPSTTPGDIVEGTATVLSATVESFFDDVAAWFILYFTAQGLSPKDKQLSSSFSVVEVPSFSFNFCSAISYDGKVP